MTVSNPFHGMPRIVPPMGERRPITGQAVEPLPLEPSVVPDPPVSPDSIPRRVVGVTPALGVAPKVETPAAAMPAPPTPTPVEPAVPNHYILAKIAMEIVDAPAFSDDWSFEQKILWLLHRYPEEQVRQHWAAQGDYLGVVAKRQEYLAAIAAGSAPVVQATSQDDDLSPADLAAIHAETPPREPEPMAPTPVRLGDLWVHGADRQASRIYEILDDGTVKLENGQDMTTTTVRILQSPTSGWRFVGVGAAQQQQQAASAAASNPPKRRLGRVQRERIEALAKEGKSAEEIGRTLDLPIELVQRGLADMPQSVPVAAPASPAQQTPLPAAQAYAAYARPEAQEAELERRRAAVEQAQPVAEPTPTPTPTPAPAPAPAPVASSRRMSVERYQSLKRIEAVLNYYAGTVLDDLDSLPYGQRLGWLADHLRAELDVLDDLDLGDRS